MVYLQSTAKCIDVVCAEVEKAQVPRAAAKSICGAVESPTMTCFGTSTSGKVRPTRPPLSRDFGRYLPRQQSRWLIPFSLKCSHSALRFFSFFLLGSCGAVVSNILSEFFPRHVGCFSEKYKNNRSCCSGGDRSFLPNSFCVFFGEFVLLSCCAVARCSSFLARFLTGMCASLARSLVEKIIRCGFWGAPSGVGGRLSQRWLQQQIERR